MANKDYEALPVLFTGADPIEDAEIEEAVIEEIAREMEEQNVQSED